MIVNKDKCIGCTLCQQDCVASDIEMIDEKAHIRNLTIQENNTREQCREKMLK